MEIKKLRDESDDIAESPTRLEGMEIKVVGLQLRKMGQVSDPP